MEDQNQNNKGAAVIGDVTEPVVASDGNAELDVCKKQAEEYLNNWKRERADFVNYKKDEGKRMGGFVKLANEALILELLDPMHDLCLAVKQVKDARLDSARLAGLEQVIKKFEDLLKKYGVEKIEVGDPSMGSGQVKFDPMYHEIVNGTEGEKIEEIRAGYTMYGRVIRPTRVKIIK